MDRYVSNFTNPVDAKGRVSIPASYRATLARDGFAGLFVHPALELTALDCGGGALLGEIDRLLATLPPYSDERDSFATALLGVSEVLKIDGEGRVILTDSLKTYAGVGDRVTFVGQGSKFQMWEPERFHAHLAAARDRLRAYRLSGAGPRPSGSA